MIRPLLNENNSLKIILIWILLMACLIVIADLCFNLLDIVSATDYSPVAVTALTGIMGMIIGMIVKDIMVILQAETEARIKMRKKALKKKRGKKK